MSKHLNEAQQRAFEALTRMDQKAVMVILKGGTHEEAYAASGGKQVGKGRLVYITQMLQKDGVKNFMRLMNEEILSEHVMSKEQALKRLTTIAYEGKNERDSIAAIKEIADMQGWHAPTRSQMEIAGGVSHRYSPEDYAEAAGAIRGHFDD